jgi:hypothetical protein
MPPFPVVPVLLLAAGVTAVSVAAAKGPSDKRRKELKRAVTETFSEEKGKQVDKMTDAEVKTVHQVVTPPKAGEGKGGPRAGEGKGQGTSTMDGVEDAKSILKKYQII